MHIESHREAEVPSPLRAQQVDLQHQAWPSDEPPTLEAWHDPALLPVSVLLLDGDRVVAALDILSTSFMHRGETYAASGLSAVVTDRSEQRKGHGGHLVGEARRMIAASGSDLAIFTCDRPLRAFYERAGWRCLEGTVLVGGTPEVPYPSDLFDKVTLAAFFSARARAASGSFVGSRIELYPGEIDKLW
jgi:aminoglycoside 2'-N-acetyltransferase I